MNVGDAVTSRTSIRAFLGTPVPDSTIAELLEQSSRAASGGNVQPWRIYVVGTIEEPGYDVYPPKLWEPYRSNRFDLGEQMYALLGIARDDRDARLRRMAENFNFFGAPAAIFCFIDRRMGPPQWSDLGMFLATFMLLARDADRSRGHHGPTRCMSSLRPRPRRCCSAVWRSATATPTPQ